MKNFILTLAIALSLAISCHAKSFDDSQLPESAINTLKNSIMLFDNGLYESALEDFDKLAKEYPESYLIQYERMITLYRLKRYDDVEKLAKKVMKFDNATPIVYQIYGNALDDSGKKDKAIKIYKEGLKRFPDDPETAMLRLEIGIIYLRDNNYVDAIQEFQEGILANPDFASNYYRAAQILFASGGNNKAWALVYGETAVLLAPENQERLEEMAADILNLWKESITFKTDKDGKTEADVSLVKSRDISLNPDNQQAALSFPGVFEGAATLTINRNLDIMNPFTGSFNQLLVLRKGIIENYFKVTDNLFGNSMYLFPYLKSLIDAGHWEAYNYYLFGSLFPEELQSWYNANPGKLENFVKWYNDHIFTLDATHSVSDRLIDRDRRNISFIDAIIISGSFLSDKESEADDEQPSSGDGK